MVRGVGTQNTGFPDLLNDFQTPDRTGRGTRMDRPSEVPPTPSSRPGSHYEWEVLPQPKVLDDELGAYDR